MKTQSMLVDFHCHLAEAGGYSALAGDQSLLHEPGFVIAVTNRPREWQALMKGGSPPNVLWSIGLHPGLHHDESAVAAFLEVASSAAVIGEVGLDYSTSAATAPVEQRRRFSQLLGAIAGRGVLVSVHSRNAASDTVDLLRRHELPGVVLHWFLGAAEDIETAIEANCYFSVNEAMLASPRGRFVVQALPPNRVLLETDAPYGGVRRRRIRPGELDRVLADLATIWERTVEESQALVAANQKVLAQRLGASLFPDGGPC